MVVPGQRQAGHGGSEGITDGDVPVNHVRHQKERRHHEKAN